MEEEEQKNSAQLNKDIKNVPKISALLMNFSTNKKFFKTTISSFTFSIFKINLDSDDQTMLN